jgi:hypothetical protein
MDQNKPPSEIGVLNMFHLTEAGAALGVDALFQTRLGVYWNLSKRVWSFKTDTAVGPVARGTVVAWADASEVFALTDVTFHVSAAMHRNALSGKGKRVRADGSPRRNVVAWVIGKLADGTIATPTPTRVTFHWPDTRSVFHVAATGAPITSAGVAVFRTDTDPDGSPHGTVWV